MKHNKIAVVAGVGPCLGAALSKALVEAGYYVAALARTTRFGKNLQQELNQSGNNFNIFHCDVTDDNAVRETFDKISKQHGEISVFIHNTGNLLIKGLIETHPQEFEDMWRLTCLGAFHCSRYALAEMLKNNSGTIIFTGATAALRGGENFSAFASAKFALRGLAQSMAREYGPQGIHVAHVNIDGLLWGEQAEKRFGSKKELCLDPAAVAENYLFLINQHRSAWTQELDLRPDVEEY